MMPALMNQVIPFASGLVLFFALWHIAVHHQRLFLALFMFLTALESTRDFALGLEVTLAGNSVYPNDFIMVICGTVALARIGRWRLRWITRTATLALVTLVALGLFTWVSTLGLQFGVNFWRLEMLMVALFAYTTTRPRAWSWNDLWVIIVAPAIVVALASVVGILVYGLGSSSSEFIVNGVMKNDRPVLAWGSLLMLIGLWIVVLSAGKWSARRVVSVLLLGSMVLLTQTRSVWVAAILGAVVWWLAPRIRLRGTSGGMGGISRTLFVSGVAAATVFVGTSLVVLGRSASDTSTFQWRVARWAHSLSISRSWNEWLVGSAFGPTPVSTPSLFATSAHSLYVSSIELTGLIGLGAILCLLFAVGRSHLLPAIGPLGLVVCFTFLGYGVTYQLPPWAWIVSGILLASTQVEHPEEPRTSSNDQMRDLRGGTDSEELASDWSRS